MKKLLRAMYFMTAITVSLLIISCGGDSDNSSHSGPIITGVVADDPLVNAFVTVYGPDGAILGEGLTDTTGTYHIPVQEAEEYQVVADGGTMGGVPFYGAMESVCRENPCDVTPLTTIAARLVDRDALSRPAARRQAARILGFPSDGPDLFALAVRGEKDDSGEIEGLDQVRLDYLRSQIADSETFDVWLGKMMAKVPAPHNASIAGTAIAGHPVAGASVSIVVDEGREPFTSTTSADGIWESPPDMKITGPFRVEVSGGSTFISKFDGTLSAWIPFQRRHDEAVPKLIKVNVISTIIDRYMQHSGLGYDGAVTEVKRFLSIPEEFDINGEGLYRYFSGGELVTRSSENLGFDFFVDSLVNDIDSGKSVTIGGAGNADFGQYDIIKTGLGTKIFDGVVGGLASGGLSFALNTGMTYLLPALGYETAEQELQSTLNKINTDLKSLVETSNKISSDVKTVLSNLDITESVLLKGIEESKVNDKIGIILNQFDNMILLVPEKEAEDEDAEPEVQIPSRDEIATFRSSVDTFFGSLKDEQDIDQRLFDIHAGVFGDPRYPSNTTVLKNLTEELEKKLGAADIIHKEEKLWEFYIALENYFTKFMAIQIQGCILMTNKLNWESRSAEASQLVQTRKFVGTADTFMESKIIPRIQLQVDSFMESVERLVVASADTRTIVQGRNPMFPATADDVFYSADLIAQQFSPDHKAAFILRVAGDPTVFEQYLAGPQGGNNFGQPEYIPLRKYKDGKLVYIPIREYEAPIPADYPDYYLGWYLDKNKRWHFKNQTTIKIAKIRFPKMEGNLDPTTRNDFPFFRTYDYPYNQKDVVSFKKINLMTGEETPEGFPYGNSFVTARAVPSFMHGFTDTENQSGEFKAFEVNFSPKDAELSSYFSVESGEGHVSVTPQIHFEFYNENDSEVRLRARVKGEAQIKNEGSGLDEALDLQQENNWEIWVNAEKLFQKDRLETLYEYKPIMNYDVTTTWPAYKTSNDGRVVASDPAESKEFSIKPANKRQIFLKGRRHGFLWKNYHRVSWNDGNRTSYYTLPTKPDNLTALFKTKLLYFKLVPQ